MILWIFLLLFDSSLHANLAHHASARYAPFPISSHRLQALHENAHIVELEDGSSWEIAKTDVSIAATWHLDDPLIISPDYSWFSAYRYFIHNKANNTSIKADIERGPVAFDAHAHWIVHIDPTNHHIYLEDGNIFCVHPKDALDLAQWKVNNHVILGNEDSTWTYYPHILINVDLSEFIRVKQY